MRHTPSLVMVRFNQSRKLAVKLMQRLPSHVPLPLLFTVLGMFFVSSSSSRCRIPFLLRNPTIILGTPRRNDCIQNFSSFRSYLSMSLSFSISADVFSSTQWMGSSLLSGLQSHTAYSERRVWHCAWSNSPASTSPPMISLALPIPVRTTEQYWALLLTTRSSRVSMNSRVVGSHWSGSSDRVSNL